jgi:hypothetical protein
MHRDRTGELIDEPTAPAPWHDPRCHDGWLPETTDRRPVPCLTCRPHIAEDLDRRRRRGSREIAATPAREAAMTAIRAALADTRQRRTTVAQPPEENP